ncbi:MAG TPA: PAS domain S-box protein [Rhizomicrobium sp.]|nr:PAS domain S-box protein [Rhizomicrobium sp.]
MPLTRQDSGGVADDNSLFDALIATAVDGIMVIDEKGSVRIYNQACERLFGYTAAEVIGHSIKMLMPAPYREEHDSYLKHYVTTGEKHIIGIGREVQGRRKDGSVFPMNLSVGEGVIRGERIFLGIITDISDRLSRERRILDLQSEMLHVSRLTDMGQVAAGLAHELNQPLTAILNYTNAGLDIADERGDEELKSVFGKVAEQASRAGNIIRRLRAFIEKRGPNRTDEDITRTIDEAIRLGQLNASERGIKLRVLFEQGLPSVSIDRVQIQQVLINLMKNAAEAMEGLPRRELTVTISRVTPELVQVSVADTGPGISEDMAEKLFQPFVTTKATGMGMGLSICRGIVEAHGGRLWLENNPGGGAVFRFNVPVAQDAKS